MSQVSILGGAPTGSGSSILAVPQDHDGGSGSSIAVIWPAPAAVTMPAGTPVVLSDGAVAPGTATTSGGAQIVGVLADAVTAGSIAQVCSNGALTLTIAQWDAVVTDGSGGLAPGASYYVDEPTGALTVIPPGASGDFDTLVLRALTATIAIVGPQAPIGPL